MAWESRQWIEKYENGNICKADPSLKSFLFTLKNPDNVPARRFALKSEEKENAINCHSHVCQGVLRGQWFEVTNTNNFGGAGKQALAGGLFMR
jgi:hypothetical protein